MLVIGPDNDLLVRLGEDKLVHLSGWLVAVDPDTGVIHAVDAVALRDPKAESSKTRVTACRGQAQVYAIESDCEGRAATVLWPPRVSTLADGASRCRECHRLTGKPRPSGYFPPADAEVGA